MGEALGVAASIIAVVQISSSVISLCKSYIKGVADAPKELRSILVEISSLRAVFEAVQFLEPSDDLAQAMIGPDGPVEGCKSSITELERLLSEGRMSEKSATQKPPSKKRKLAVSLERLAWPLKRPKAEDLLRSIAQYKSSIMLAICTDVRRDTKHIKDGLAAVQTKLSAFQEAEVLQWLRDTDPSPLHNIACERHEQDTCQWMLRSTTWKNWLHYRSGARSIWLHGIPGSGKTVLAASLMQCVKRMCEVPSPPQIARLGFAYYYCHFSHNQDEGVPMLKWIISQLCRRSSTSIPNELYEMYHQGCAPTIDQLLEALSLVVKAFDRTFIMIDALDESLPRETLLEVIRTIATDVRFQKIQLFTTSREYGDIERAMRPISIPTSMNNSEVRNDIVRVIHKALRSKHEFSRWTDKLREEVERALVEGAQGMFRWAVCQLDIMRRLRSTAQIRESLKSLPRSIEEAYERIFSLISEEDRAFVRETLLCVSAHQSLPVNSPSPLVKDLSTETLLVLVRRRLAGEVGTEDPEDDSHCFYDLEALKDICGCLISTYKAGRSGWSLVAVTLAHYTVEEFLSSGRIGSSATSFFTLQIDAALTSFAEAVFANALQAQAEKSRYEALEAIIARREQVPWHSPQIYCLTRCLLLLEQRTDIINKVERLAQLSIDLYDTSKPHFKIHASLWSRLWWVGANELLKNFKGAKLYLQGP